MMATATKASTRSAARSLRISVVIYLARPDLDRHGAKLTQLRSHLTAQPTHQWPPLGHTDETLTFRESILADVQKMLVGEVGFEPTKA